MTTHVSFHNAKPFLQSWLPPDVMQTIEDSCDLSRGVTIKRLNRSYDGLLHDTIIVRFDTLKGNQFEIEFVYDISLRLERQRKEEEKRKEKISQYE